MPLDQMSYDELPYTCSAMPYAQPDRLATLATLFGMTPPTVATCRVLELGCCDGSNIIATAHQLPQATCWGIDLSAQQIAKGQALIKALGLPNITLQQLNILEVEEDFGQFDYIIAHGIYSWVPVPVQAKIFQICQQHLAPQGVAYISYNTKPGWNIRDILRDMMRYYGNSSTIDAPERIEPLRNLLKLIATTTTATNNAYNQMISEELTHFIQLPESFIFKEFLEEEHYPEYFYQFIAKAHSYGLEYLADAFFPTMLVSNSPSAVAAELQVFQNQLIQQEQMMDCLRNRRFRHTLLCHQGTPLNRHLSSAVLKYFYIASSLQPVANTAKPFQQFANQQGSVSTEQPIIQSALHYLNQRWPRAVAFSELITQIKFSQDYSTDVPKPEIILADALFNCYAKGLIEWYTHPPQLVTTITTYPQASSLARWQVQHSQKVTNQRCEVVTIENGICLRLLPYLDGSHDKAALLKQLNDWVEQGLLTIHIKHQETGEAISLSAENQPAILAKLLADALQLIAQAALLVA
jgi:methyltransferase-like protein/2-polyprenyl-3-methyl-5-hydroxy-6-metoxy-1,4-benzoquinol methylase